jgi:Ran GTPase-activating protein (RanGAP) involved in mRNA processing and transport
VPTLTTLVLRSNEINLRSIADLCLSGLMYNKTLLQLNLGHNNLGDEGTINLMQCLCQSGNETLQMLQLDNNHISDAAADQIGRTLNPYFSKCKLTHIGLENNMLGESGTV